MTKEHEITIRMPEYSPEIVWRSGARLRVAEGETILCWDPKKFPGLKVAAHSTKEGVLKVQEYHGITADPYSQPLEEAKGDARQKGFDWLLVFDVDMEVLDAYQL